MLRCNGGKSKIGTGGVMALGQYTSSRHLLLLITVLKSLPLKKA